MTARPQPFAPRRGEVYDFDPNPVRGRELGQKPTRPGLIVSDDLLNAGPSGLVVVVPITSTIRTGQPLHFAIAPPEGGLDSPSDLCCEHLRSISVDRLTARRGVVSAVTLAAIEARLRTLLTL